MSTPNPLIPQGTFQAQAAKGASNVRLAVATIVAIHVVFFGGLLLQGCKRDPKTTQTATEQTNTNTAADLALPPLDSSSLYYTNAVSLPGDAATSAGTAATPSQGPGALQSATPDALWHATNLSSPVVTRTTPEGESSGGPMKEYTVVSGDHFGRIAQKNQTTVSALRKANPNVDPAKIRPGQKLNIPAPTRSTAAPTGGSLNTSAADGDIYTVKPGDNLSKIAKAHGVTVGQLRAANGLKTAGIKAGQKLKIPARSQAANNTNSNPPPNPTF